jgi:hypothetical protein
MARAKKLWRVVKALPPQEWAPMKEVWQRAEKLIGPDLQDMQRDLRQEFLDEHLIAAVRLFAPKVERCLAPDGREIERIIYTETTRIILEPECWRWLKINYAWSITGWELIPEWKTIPGSEGEHRVVVRRHELDKFCQTADATQLAKAQSRVAAATSAPVKRWRTPPPPKDIEGALKDIREAEPTLSGEKLASALCERLGEGMTRQRARDAIKRYAPDTVKRRGRPRKNNSPK